MQGWIVIGLMSGTSVDGIDGAVLETDGVKFRRLDCHGFFQYRDETRNGIWQAVANPRVHMADAVGRQTLDRYIAEDHAAAVQALIAGHNLSPTLIGFHGQTIYHNPGFDKADGDSLGRGTIQLGDADLLAWLCGIDVVHDVRRADMQAGGQGAPLAPVYHAALFTQMGLSLPAIMVNVGGVANLTWLDMAGQLIGFDTGPGNALLDDYMRLYCNAEYDAGGQLAARGRPDAGLVASWQDDDTGVSSAAFFAQAWPKSLDRKAFHDCLEDPRLLAHSAADAMATLTLFTAQSIADAIASLPAPPQTVLLAGGGRHNACLRQMLEQRIGPALKTSSDAYQAFSPDMLEAELMAFLAARHRAGLATSFPGTTGCAAPICGGALATSNALIR